MIREDKCYLVLCPECRNGFYNEGEKKGRCPYCGKHVKFEIQVTPEQREQEKQKKEEFGEKYYMQGM